MMNTSQPCSEERDAHQTRAMLVMFVVCKFQLTRKLDSLRSTIRRLTADLAAAIQVTITYQVSSTICMLKSFNIYTVSQEKVSQNCRIFCKTQQILINF